MAKTYKLRQSAKDDIKDIGRYTLEEHGRLQLGKYLKGLADRFALLGDNPTLGRLRNDIKEGYYCKEYEEHVIFYLIRHDYIEIVAVLHRRMIPQRHL